MTPSEARDLQAENARLKRQVDELTAEVRRLTAAPPPTRTTAPPPPVATLPRQFTATESLDNEQLYQAIKKRLIAELPQESAVLQVLAQRPELVVEVQRVTVTADGTSAKGRIARLVAGGFFDGGRTNGATRKELARTGPDANNATIANVLNELVALGFLTREGGDNFVAVPGMKVRVEER